MEKEYTAKVHNGFAITTTMASTAATTTSATSYTGVNFSAGVVFFGCGSSAVHPSSSAPPVLQSSHRGAALATSSVVPPPPVLPSQPPSTLLLPPVFNILVSPQERGGHLVALDLEIHSSPDPSLLATNGCSTTVLRPPDLLVVHSIRPHR